MPEQGISCTVTEQQARANALHLVRQYPDAFAGHNVEDAIQNDMMLFYFPMALADLRMMASFPGKGLNKEALVYYEVLDWAYPRANYLDVRLMGILEPWDFSKVAPFDPAMQEGDFRVIAVDASTKDNVVIDKLALDIAGNDAESALGFNKKSIRKWARKARKHKDGCHGARVFCRPSAEDGRDGEQVQHRRSRTDRSHGSSGVQRKARDAHRGAPQSEPASFERKHRARNAYRGQVRQVAFLVPDRPPRWRGHRTANCCGKPGCVSRGKDQAQGALRRNFWKVAE